MLILPPSKRISVHPSSTHSKTPPPSQPKCCLIRRESTQHVPNSEEESLSSDYGMEVDETGSQPTIEDIGSQSVEDMRSQPYLNFDADSNIEVSVGSPEVNSALTTGSQAISSAEEKNRARALIIESSNEEMEQPKKRKKDNSREAVKALRKQLTASNSPVVGNCMAKSGVSDGKQKPRDSISSTTATIRDLEAPKLKGLVNNWASKPQLQEDNTIYHDSSFEDKDESEECAAITGKQRTDNLKMIKIEENTLITKLTKAKNSDLPQGCLQGNWWRSVFVPTYKKLLGTTENPWMASDHKSLEAIQATWNTIYPDINTYIEPDFSTYKARQEFSKSMVSDLAFLYANLGNKISTFAPHLNSINGTINVEALCEPGTHEQSSDTDKFPPLGTLAMLAAAAKLIKSYLKPIPKLNKATGKETSSHGNFSETNWGTVTRNYHTSMKKLQLGTLEDIVEQAQHVQTHTPLILFVAANQYTNPLVILSEILKVFL
ncbi:hypothetical protein SERLA73DRAFT_156020 [Serpula lacrymans var. lacrymans S7.3]|uniref:Uncharacterized protein n=1 Tax=Serpula lacrymans var. lacrymans (strain S7.3) TaxID=936435 RepID=F8QCK9_SERL3|nr:hypothetical protein SERLA73DRAFT_156020 [Serpula lacrymans var. lacrymans S7.3]